MGDSKTEKNIHKGHRVRLKKKYIEKGIDSLAEHEVLEMLLFYCVPYKDTNELAHEILQKIGSLHNLFDSSVEDIVRICGVTENMAVLLSLTPQLYKRYVSSKYAKKTVIQSLKVAEKYVKSMYAGETKECMYMICLDTQKRLIGKELIRRGTSDRIDLSSREIVELALKNKASSVLLSHNHPGGTLYFSEEDLDATRRIIKALNMVEISVVDHIIVADNECFSFAAKKLLNMCYD